LTPPASKTPPVQPDPSTDPMDISFDDEQLRELMEQNEKLEKELASRLEPKKEAQQEEKKPVLTAAAGASASSTASPYLPTSFESKKEGISGSSQAPFLDMVEENSEEEAAGQWDANLGFGRSLPPGAGGPSLGVTASPASEEEPTARAHQAAPQDSSASTGAPGMDKAPAAGGATAFGRRGGEQKLVGRKKEATGLDFDSFLDEFVKDTTTTDSPLETTPQAAQKPSPHDQPQSAGDTTPPPTVAAEVPSLSQDAFTTDWSPPTRKRAAAPKGRPRGEPSNTKQQEPDLGGLPIFEEKNNTPGVGTDGASAMTNMPGGSGETKNVRTQSATSTDPTSREFTLEEGASTSSSTMRQSERRKMNMMRGEGSSAYGDDSKTIFQPQAPRNAATSSSAAVSGTQNVTELRVEIGRLTGLLAFTEAKAAKLQDELDQSAHEKRKKVIQMEEERAIDRGRWEIEQRRLESEVKRLHESVVEEQRRANELKTRQKEMIDVERQDIRRECDQRMKDETARLRRQAAQEQEHMEIRHRRHVESLSDQHAREMDGVRVASKSSVELTTVMDRVQDTTVQVESLARRLDSAKAVQEDSVKNQLDQRERNVASMERHCQDKLAEVEAQRRKLTQVIDSMKDDRSSGEAQVKHARERLDRDHERVLELLATTKEREQASRTLLDEQRAQFEEERRAFEIEKEAGLSREKELRNENEATMRKLKKERDALDALRRTVEQAEMNCGRRIQESETIVTSERRNLMVDLEVLAERERAVRSELEAVETKQAHLQVEAARVHEEGTRVRLFAAELHQKSEDICALYQHANKAKEESQKLHAEVRDSEKHIASEKSNLQSLHTLVEHQRLELMKETTVYWERRDLNPRQLPRPAPVAPTEAPAPLMQPNPQEMPQVPPTFWAPPPAAMTSHEELENQLQEWTRKSVETKDRISQLENNLGDYQTSTPPFPSSWPPSGRDKISTPHDSDREKTDPYGTDPGLHRIPIPFDATFEAHRPNYPQDRREPRSGATTPPMIPSTSLRTLDPLPSEVLPSEDDL